METDSILQKTTESGNSTAPLLDGRYRIIRMIGEGGFGITYEAVNIHNSMRVAVKECKSEADNARFLREARVLRDFAEEPAVVTVLDSFEENDKAYIVMEYLDGVTLSHEIRKNGKWPTEKAVRSLVPVMKVLEKMHSTGVIHRDISPDNLMVMPDGSVILMDFGAALPTEKNEFTRTAVFKSVYSPPEQRDDVFQTGSWSDVYALCATIWYCITGTEPEDSLSRLLFDELQKPSEAGADILPAAEQALMKGLVLIKNVRTQDIFTLRTELETVYPDLSEEQKKEIERRKKRRKKIIIGCICAAAAITAVCLYIFRINILFSFIETETIALDGREMSDEEYAESTRIVRERFQSYVTGNRVLIRENDRQLFFEIPFDDLPDTGDVSLNDVIRSSVTRPMVLSVLHFNSSDDSFENLGTYSQTTDIVGFETDGDDALITFSEDAAAEMDGLLEREDEAVWFWFDSGADYARKLSYEGTTLGDGTTVRVSSQGLLNVYNNNGIVNWGEYSVPMSLMKMHFTNAPSPKAFQVDSEWITQWENKNDTMFPGKNQKNENEIPGRTVSVRYSLSRTDFEHEGYNPSLFSFQAVLKNRLDSLEVPYSVGIDRRYDNTYVVRVPSDAVWAEELKCMGESISLSLGSSLTFSSSLTFYSSDYTGIAVEKYEGGTFSLILTVSNYNTETTADVISTASEQGDGMLYLYLNDLRSNYQIACCDTESALASLTSNGTIKFDRFTFASCPVMDADTAHFANWLVTSFSESAQDRGSIGTMTPFGEMEAETRDENGQPVYFYNEDLLPRRVFETAESLAAKELVDEWNELYSETMYFEYDTSVRQLSAEIYGIDSFYEFTQLLRDNEAENKSMYFGGGVRIRLYDSDHDSASPGKNISVTYSMSFEEGTLVQNQYLTTSDDTDPAINALKEILEQYPTL